MNMSLSMSATMEILLYANYIRARTSRLGFFLWVILIMLFGSVHTGAISLERVSGIFCVEKTRTMGELRSEFEVTRDGLFWIIGLLPIVFVRRRISSTSENGL